MPNDTALETETIIAHITDNGVMQTLDEHLRNTAKLAKEYGNSFGIGTEAYLAGLYHDIGKSSEAFQRKIRRLFTGKVDHSTAGAIELMKTGYFAASLAVAGHHCGILDYGNRLDSFDATTLVGRSKREVPAYTVPNWVSEILDSTNIPNVSKEYKSGFSLAFHIRMVYSCLADADFIDTERFMRGDQHRNNGKTCLPLLNRVREREEIYLSHEATDKMALNRNKVLRQCIEAGRNSDPGLYTLTGPTGIGKTMASVVFAMEHAKRNGLKRVIYVGPYMSVIDQVTDVYRDLFGEENVLEHHSSADYLLMEYDEMNASEYKKLLASENWDSPVVATTAVQFFESLFSNRPSKCRKLHNMANAIIIFDEAQTLPTDYLIPCVASIAELVKQCRSSVVLASATQPALEPFFKELTPELKIQEICEDYEETFKELQRVTLNQIGEINTTGLADKLAKQKQVLCVVNLRSTAQTLYNKLPKEKGTYCLTTLLCGKDRRRKIAEIRERLKKRETCRVISTSLIEAGVDVDFPTAYREEAGLDSILQTAGRCNREWKRPIKESDVYVFSFTDVKTPKYLNQAMVALDYVKEDHEDLQSPEAIHDYFYWLYKSLMRRLHSLDKADIMKSFNEGINGCALPFAQVAEKARVIDDKGCTVYLPIDAEGEKLCEKLENGEYSNLLMRKLGVYSVSIFEKDYKFLLSCGAIKETDEETAILKDLSKYSRETGIECQRVS